jgi:hypothetical protein
MGLLVDGLTNPGGKSVFKADQFANERAVSGVGISFFLPQEAVEREFAVRDRML